MENDQVYESDLPVLLEKKVSLLEEILLTSQQQLPEQDLNHIERLFDKKQKCIENLKQVDGLIELWNQRYSRNPNTQEQHLFERMEDVLKEILQVEEKLRHTLQQQRRDVTKELHELSNKEQLKGYLGSNSKTGKHLNLKQ